MTAPKDIKVHYNAREPCIKEVCSFEKVLYVQVHTEASGSAIFAALRRPHTFETSMLA